MTTVLLMQAEKAIFLWTSLNRLEILQIIIPLSNSVSLASTLIFRLDCLASAGPLAPPYLQSAQVRRAWP